MKIKTALILCAGYGKRLNPLTHKTPKPLLKFKNFTMLEHTINFIENLGLKNKIFDFYIKKQKNLNLNKFKNDFEILSVLRNLKIIGIFTRLAIRDGKKNT